MTNSKPTRATIFAAAVTLATTAYLVFGSRDAPIPMESAPREDAARAITFDPTAPPVVDLTPVPSIDEAQTDTEQNVVERVAIANRSAAPSRGPEIAILEGTVVNAATGAPITDATITLIDDETKARRVCALDADGKFTARPLAAGHSFVVELVGATWKATADPVSGLVSGANQRTICVDLGYLVRGRVVEIDHGIGREKVRVDLRVDGDGTAQSFVSGDDGAFSFYIARNDPDPKVAPHEDPRVELFVRRAPFISIVTHPNNGFGTTTVVPRRLLAKDQVWLVYVGRGSEIQGAVRDAQGRAFDEHVRPYQLGGRAFCAAEQLLRNLPSEGDGASRGLNEYHFFAHVGIDGRFKFTDLPPRLEGDLSLTLESGYRLVVPVPRIEFDGSRASVEFTVPDTFGTIAIEVLLDGRPSEATVEWFAEGARGSFDIDKHGRTVRTGIPAGLVRLDVLAGPEFVCTTKRLSVKPGETSPLAVAATTSDFVRGRVIGSDESPIGGLTVRAERRDHEVDLEGTRHVEKQSLGSATTDSDGRFAFERITARDSFTVVVDDPAYIGETDVGPGSVDFDLVVRKRKP